MQNKPHNKAFTITELLTVIGALTVLLVMVCPVCLYGRVTSKRTLCQFNLRTYAMATDVYCNDNAGNYPAPSNNNSCTPFWMTSQWSESVGMYISGDTEFICPSITDQASQEPYGSYAYSMSFYHSPEQINSISSSNQTECNDPEMKAQLQKSEIVASHDSKIIFGEWHSSHAMNDNEKGWWNWSGKRNFVFADGHTKFIDANDINSANDGYPDANVTIDGIKGSDYN